MYPCEIEMLRFCGETMQHITSAHVAGIQVNRESHQRGSGCGPHRDTVESRHTRTLDNSSPGALGKEIRSLISTF